MSDEDSAREDLVLELERLRNLLATLEAGPEGRQDVAEGLRSLCYLDDQTGIYNRNTFFVLGVQHLRLAGRHKRPMLLLCCRLEGSRYITDHHGDDETDRAVAEAADLLRQTLRQSDIIARVGPEEFAVLAIEASGSEALTRRIGRTLRERNTRDDVSYPLCMSVGMAAWDPEDPCPLRQLLQQARDRMQLHGLGKP